MTTGGPICPKHGFNCRCEELSRQWLGYERRYRPTRQAIELGETWRLEVPELLNTFMREKLGRENWHGVCMDGHGVPFAVLTVSDAMELLARAETVLQRVTAEKT